MMTLCLKPLMIVSLTVVFAAAAHAEDADVGKVEFQASCASCHGVDGKGRGPVAEQLKVPPADLTALAKNNNGVFPITAVYEAIDGRRTISAHGTHEMPIWGERYNPVKSLPHIVDPGLRRARSFPGSAGGRRANTNPRRYRLSEPHSAKVATVKAFGIVVLPILLGRGDAISCNR
ncbi:c-type cytochrome [Bradyrhizobium sp. JR3.5]